MKLSQKTIYALRAIYALARAGQDGTRTMNDIKDEQDIPGPFLQIIMRELRAAGFVESRRGKDGGYSLAGRPEDVCMGQVIRHFEGDFAPVECASRTEWPESVFQPVWQQVQQAQADIYDNITFAELVERGRLILGGPILDFVI